MFYSVFVYQEQDHHVVGYTRYQKIVRLGYLFSIIMDIIQLRLLIRFKEAVIKSGMILESISYHKYHVLYVPIAIGVNCQY